MAIGMAIGVLVEALLPGGGGAVASPPPPKNEKSPKEWIKNKLCLCKKKSLGIATRSIGRESC